MRLYPSLKFRCAIPRALIAAVALMLLVVSPAGPARAFTAETLDSVVSVLPVWPGQPQGGTGRAPGRAPEGSGITVRPGIVATAWHVIEPADRIEVRLADGRILPASLLAKDAATDIALLAVDAALTPLALSRTDELGAPVCAVGNAFGLGLSVTCGVISATGVSDAGFNPVEHFVQTDAAINPGASGGALVDTSGRLVGMVSAIFASDADTNLGVGFAVSAALLERVTEALISTGEVSYPELAWQLDWPDRATLARVAAPVIADLAPDGPAARAGLRAGDLVLSIDDRRTRTPRDAVAALALAPQDATTLDVRIDRSGRTQVVQVALRDGPSTVSGSSGEPDDCPYGASICQIRQAVFPVSSFDPVASATRIGPDLLVTNRHVVGDRMDAVVHTPFGPRDARVLASAYPGDLVLLEALGLPEQGFLPDLSSADIAPGDFFVVGADVARSEIRVFEPGGLISGPAEGATLGRLHVYARMQPGVSGGALVDADGHLTGIAVGGGDGRFEAIPVSDVEALLELRGDPSAVATTRALGMAFAACAAAMDSAGPSSAGERALDEMAEICLEGDNHGQLLEAGRILASARDFDGAATLHAAAVRQVPNSINARMSLLVSLQLGARFAEMTEHARWLMGMAPDDPQALRFAIQAGVWGGAPDLAEAGYEALLKADPAQAEAARRFIDNAPPAPARR